MYITDVQLEPGATANDFRRETVGTTMADCQRYWQSPGHVPGTAYFASGVVFGHSWTCEMRVNPTCAYAYSGRHDTANAIYRLDNGSTQTITWVVIHADKHGINHGYGWSPSSWANDCWLWFSNQCGGRCRIIGGYYELYIIIFERRI